MGWLLSEVDWNAVRQGVRTETKSREDYQPLISLFRWWARRPHTLIGALLDASAVSVEEGVVLDPFSGGGTVAIEAARRGLPIYAQDLNPWAAWGLRVCLTPVCPEALRAAGDQLLAQLRSAEGWRYQLDPRTPPVAHTFRVRAHRCGTCRVEYWDFPYALLSMASRSAEEGHAFFGCRRCGAVGAHRAEAGRPRCSQCEYELVDRPLRWCPSCRCVTDTVAGGRWAVVLVQRYNEVRDGRVVYLETPTPEEMKARGPNGHIPGALNSPIGRGMETVRLTRAGFRMWSDLYPRRQLQVLLSAARMVKGMDVAQSIRDRLTLCVAGTTEMPGHLCRWDRFHPKVFEALSNHRYSFDGMAVEPNPLAPVGRGSLERRIRASVTAAEWALANLPVGMSVRYAVAKQGMSLRRSASCTVVQGSSERILLNDGAASVVITDPPYYDSVQYGELASLFLAWTKAMGTSSRCGTFRSREEAVPNRRRRTGLAAYERKLNSVFGECARALRPNGKLVLTFHCTDLRAWWALGHSLHRNGFRIGALVAAETENGADHAKRGTRAFVCDLLIECVRGGASSRPRIIRIPQTPEQRELIRMGLAMAETGDGTYAELREAFKKRCTRMRQRRIETPDIGRRLPSAKTSKSPTMISAEAAG